MDKDLTANEDTYNGPQESRNEALGEPHFLSYFYDSQ